MARRIYDSVLELIGDTPLVRLNRLVPPGSATLLAKCEFSNPGGSVKDRIGLAMILEAEKQGLIKPGDTLVEPTSGNTGLGLSLVAAVRGYRVILTMPDNMSQERRNLLASFGARLILTPALEGMAGAVRKAEEIVATHPNHYLPQQFNNPANPNIHRQTTAEEIWEASGGDIDAFVAGVGTGGTITGVGELLKARRNTIQVVAVEPATSPVLSGGCIESLVHGIQGIGAGFIPQVLNRDLLDRVITVSDEDAYFTARRLSLEEGLLVGISSGANVYASLQVARELGADKVVVTILADTGERYLSLRGYFE